MTGGPIDEARRLRWIRAMSRDPQFADQVTDAVGPSLHLVAYLRAWNRHRTRFERTKPAKGY